MSRRGPTRYGVLLKWLVCSIVNPVCGTEAREQRFVNEPHAWFFISDLCTVLFVVSAANRSSGCTLSY